MKQILLGVGVSVVLSVMTQSAFAKGATDVNGDGLFIKDEIVQARQNQRSHQTLI